MKNQFDHLKTKLISKQSKDDFISGAKNSETAVRSKKKISKENILLSVTGKITREDCGKPFLISLKKDTEAQITTHCLGSRQAIINYLVKRGLEELIQKGEFILENE